MKTIMEMSPVPELSPLLAQPGARQQIALHVRHDKAV